MVTYAAYKCHSPTIWEVILKVIGSEKESTASQIKFLQSIDFNAEDWLIAMHDAKVINLTPTRFLSWRSILMSPLHLLGN